MTHKCQNVDKDKSGCCKSWSSYAKWYDAEECASSGMICSMKRAKFTKCPKEKGIMVLDDSYEIGQAFFE